MVKSTASFIILMSLHFTVAQNSKEIDSTNIISYADKFVVKINADTQTDIYTLRNHQDGTKLTLTPNNNYRLFASLDYQFFGLSIGFSPTFFAANNDDDLKGESSFSDFKFRAAFGHWIQGFQLSKIKGYYIENTNDFFPGWTEGVDPYLQIPDLTSKIYGMYTSYNFNSNFSFRNILYQTEWQKKSAGSFIPTLYYSFNQLSYSLGGDKLREDSFPLRLSAGYYYTLVVHENWYLNGNLSPSVGVKFTKSSLTNANNERFTEKYNSFTSALEGGMQLGYDSKKIVFGASVNFDINGYKEDKLNAIENDKIYGVIYFGYRFETPGFIDRTYNKFAKKIGL